MNAVPGQEVSDAAELRNLRRLVVEAMAVMADWERVWDALGRPGLLGQSKAKASLAEVIELRAVGADIEDTGRERERGLS